MHGTIKTKTKKKRKKKGVHLALRLSTFKMSDLQQIFRLSNEKSCRELISEEVEGGSL